MGRHLLKIFYVLITLSTSFAGAQTQFYLNSSEKSIIALALKSIQADPAEQIELVKNIYLRLKRSEHKTQKKIKINSHKELVESMQNEDLFSNYNLSELNNDDLLAEIKSVEYYSDIPTLQKRIDNYINKRTETLRNSSLIIGLAGFDLALQNRSSNQELKDFVTTYIENKSAEFVSKMNATENPQALVIGKLLKAYFLNLPESQKIEIVYQLSKLPIDANHMDFFLVMIQNSGPQIQKLIQIMGRSANIPKDFQDVFQKLESQVSPVPWRKVKSLIENEGLKVSDFDYFEKKPVGVGTMAQTHRVQMTDENGERQSLVIRFLKPNIEKMVEMDYQILKTIAKEIDNDPELKNLNLPSLADLIDDLNNSVTEELDLERTIKDQNKAQKIYSKSEVIRFNEQKNELQFSVPKTFSLGKNKKLMAQELVFGQKPYKELVQYKEIYPDLYTIIAEKTAELWLTEVFFKGGFFHADLHQGNMMMQITDPEIKVNLLDFGMTGQLTADQQKSALLLGLGIKTNHTELILKHLTLLSKNQKETAAFRKLVVERCLQIQRNEIKEQSLSEWIAWSLDQGQDLNYEFLKLNRGITAIEILLSDAKSSLTFDQIVQKIALKNKIYMTDLLLKEKNLKLKDYPDLLKMIKDSVPQTKQMSCKSLF